MVNKFGLKHRFMIGLFGGVLAIGLVLFSYAAHQHKGSTCGSDSHCFLSQFQSCHIATFSDTISTIEGTTISTSAQIQKPSTKDCVVRLTINDKDTFGPPDALGVSTLVCSKLGISGVGQWVTASDCLGKYPSWSL